MRNAPQRLKGTTQTDLAARNTRVSLRLSPILALCYLASFSVSAAALGPGPDLAVVYRDDAGHHVVWTHDAEREQLDISEPIAAGRNDGILAIATKNGQIHFIDDASGDTLARAALPATPLASARGLGTIALRPSTTTAVYVDDSFHAVVLGFDGKSTRWALPEGLDNAFVSQWQGQFYVSSHVAGDNGECRDTPALYEFDSETGAFTETAWEDLANGRAPLYGAWHHDDATVRRHPDDRAIISASPTEVQEIRNGDDILHVDAEMGDDDERLKAGRGFILRDDAGEYATWAIPLGTYTKLLRVSRDGDGIFGQRNQVLLRFSRNRIASPASAIQDASSCVMRIGPRAPDAAGFVARIVPRNPDGSYPSPESVEGVSGAMRLLSEDVLWVGPETARILDVLE